MQPILKLVIVGVAACSLNVDYTGTNYQCDPDGTCPSNFQCEENVCIAIDPAPPACSKQVSAGGGHTCAIRNDNTVWCWGRNDYGQLGNNTATDSTVPVQVVGVSNATAIGGGDLFACALEDSGAVWCWGRNDAGQLGNGASDSRTAVQVQGITGAKQLTVGSSHACVLAADGSAQCWGLNADGQLGDGTTNNHATPLAPTGLPPSKAISAGDNFTCAVDMSGNVRCWGNNKSGQLGTGDNNGQTMPTQAMNLANVAGIAAGTDFACANTSDGYVSCWGSGGLGNGQTDNSNVPLVVGTVVGVVALEAGNGHVCALDADKNVWCWGNDGDNRFGVSSFNNKPDVPRAQRALRFGLDLGRWRAHVRRRLEGGHPMCWLRPSRRARRWSSHDAGRAAADPRTDERRVDRSRVRTYVCLADGRHDQVLGRERRGSARQRLVHAESESDHRAGDRASDRDHRRRRSHLRGDRGAVFCWGADPDNRLGDGTVRPRPRRTRASHSTSVRSPAHEPAIATRARWSARRRAASAATRRCFPRTRSGSRARSMPRAGTITSASSTRITRSPATGA